MSNGIVTNPEYSRLAKVDGHSRVELEVVPTTATAAQVLVEHLFAQADGNIPGISYALTYRLADGHAGGDIIDIYHFDNDAVAISIADISGKGTQAAVHAALLKYGLRAYSSLGLSAEKVLRSIDRLYLENNKFERVESFASIFFGLIDPTRRLLTFGCAGHEPVAVVTPAGEVRRLEPTAPLIGVFDDQHHLFKQNFVELEPGALLIATTDGITEARDDAGEFFGMDRLLATAIACRGSSENEIMRAILAAVDRFRGERPLDDDIAIIVARFH